MNKDLKDKAISIKGKDYVQVKDRILALAEEGNYSIETNYEYFPERRMWVVKATLSIYKDGHTTVRPCVGTYTGLAQEIESDDYKQVNHSSAIENAETSAVGRACAMAGIGVLDSIASVDEINKANNRPKTSTPQPVQNKAVFNENLHKKVSMPSMDTPEFKETARKFEALGGGYDKGFFLPTKLAEEYKAKHEQADEAIIENDDGYPF